MTNITFGEILSFGAGQNSNPICRSVFEVDANRVPARTVHSVCFPILNEEINAEGVSNRNSVPRSIALRIKSNPVSSQLLNSSRSRKFRYGIRSEGMTK